MVVDAEGAGVAAACMEAEGFLLQEARAQLRGRRRDLLPGRAPAAAKPRRDRLNLDLQQVDRLVRKRALGPAARVTSPAPDNGRLAVLERPIDLPRADQRRVS